MAKYIYFSAVLLPIFLSTSTFGAFTFKILANVVGSNSGLSIDANGNLYGTTASSVFELARGAHTTSGVGSPNLEGGKLLGGVVVDAGENVYGTTVNSDDGTVFEVTAGTHTATTIAVLVGTGGENEQGGLVADSAGNLYGTEEFGGDGPGTVYEVPFNKHSASTYANTVVGFYGNSGEDPISGLIFDSAGNLYGTAAYGSPHGGGSVIEVPAVSKSLTLLAGFSNSNGGPNHPETSLVFDSAGDIFGTTTNGGADGIGDVFEVAAGSYTVSELAQFNGSNGSFPFSNLICDGSGDLFGTTNAGGIYGLGTLFEIVSGSNTITTLVSFDNTNGSSPVGDLVEDASGNIYGAATSTIFELSPAVPEPSLFGTVIAACVFCACGSRLRISN